MGEAPFLDLVHHRDGGLAKWREAIFYRWRYGGIDLPLDQAICFQFAQLGGQHGGGDAGDFAFQDFEAFGLFFCEGVDDAQFPFSAENANGIFYRANNFFSFFCFFTAHCQNTMVLYTSTDSVYYLQKYSIGTKFVP